MRTSFPDDGHPKQDMESKDIERKRNTSDQRCTGGSEAASGNVNDASCGHSRRRLLNSESQTCTHGATCVSWAPRRYLHGQGENDKFQECSGLHDEVCQRLFEVPLSEKHEA